VSQQDRLVADRFRLIRRLGAGAMASVFLAEDCELGRRVAIKRLHPEASASEIAPRFRREMRVAASLSHPNVVTLYDAIEDDGDVLLIMELVDGPTLAQRMREGAIEPGEAVRILRAIAGAVDHLHARGIIHRDVKPANILIDGAGEAKLTDLGIASAAEATGITTSGTVLGTPAYMAPELFDGARATPAADVYSVAAIAFEMLSGRRARGGGTPAVIAMRAATEPAPDLRELWPDAGPLADVLERGMARDPAQRPASATALVDAIEDALDERDLPATEVVRAAGGPPAPAPQGTAEVEVERPAAGPIEGDGNGSGDGSGDGDGDGDGSGAGTSAAAAEVAPGPRRRDERRAPTILLLGAAALALAAIAAVLIAGRGGSGADRRSASTPSKSTSSSSTTKKKSKSSSGSSSTTTRSTAPSTGSTAQSSTGSTAPPAAAAAAAAPSSPAGAVQAFYGRAVAHSYDSAWSLAAPSLRAQFGSFGRFQSTFSTARKIVFARASTIRRSANAATVAITTTTTHTDRVDHCTGTVDTAPGSDGGWVVTHLSVSC
jgi:serine/threonine protein kinase